MTTKIRKVLFLCTGNSARSVMAECILNRLGSGRFQAYSAGSHPAGRINPYALELLDREDYETKELYSKGWEEFAGAEAPTMDFVFTVCDQAAGELCPVWPGQPISAHWGFPDPAAFEGSETETRAVFADVFGQIYDRISIFVGLPIDSIERLSLQKHLDDLGKAST